ncbi:amino acid permease, partial [Pseudomonas aeruginosa]
AQASASRLLFAMGRDGVLPRPFFGRLGKRFETPVNSIVLCGVVALLALQMDVTTSTSFINFGAKVVVEDHRQVDQAEGEEGAEVDER